MSLETPSKIRTLQRELYLKAKEEPTYRFFLLYDKIYRLVSVARGPRNLRVAFDRVGLTQFGGVSLIEQFFQRLCLQRAFSRYIRFVQRNNGYSIGESLEALLYPLVLGVGRTETTEALRHNGVFHYLAGLPVYPAATSLWCFL